MQGEWQLREAKGNLSQLIQRATGGNAQVVTVHGKPTAVVVSAEESASQDGFLHIHAACIDLGVHSR